MSSNAQPSGSAGLTGAAGSLLATVRLLSEQIGPREAGSENERLAAAYAVDHLRKAGYQVDLEPFAALKTFSWTYAPLYGLAALAGLIARRAPRVSALLSIAAIALFLAESHGYRAISRLPLLPRGRSQNIVARLKLPNAEAEPEMRVVITAHLDSARSAVPFHPALVSGFRANFVLGLAAMFTVAIGSIGMAMRRRRHPGWPGRWVPAAGGYLLAQVAALLHREALMPVVAGANDNASGVAVALGAADRLAHLQGSRSQARLRPSELWIVLTGGEEAGLEGMHELLARHRAELDPETTLFLNIDNVGAGELCLISEEGMLWSHSADSELLDGAVAVALRRGLPIRVRPFHTMLTDAQIPLSRGMRAVSIMGLDERGLPPNWHWETDTWEQVDAEVMTSALDLLVRLVRRQVRKPGVRIGGPPA